MNQNLSPNTEQNMSPIVEQDSATQTEHVMEPPLSPNVTLTIH